MEKNWIYLSILFVRESLYRSVLKSRRRGFALIIERILFPSIFDSPLLYNVKWFLSGFIGGLLMGSWLPLIAWSLTFTSGKEDLVESLINSYLTLIFLISIVLVMDFIHQVISTVRELNIIEPLSHLPIPKHSYRKALVYSVLLGGALAFLIGISVASGFLIYIVGGIIYPTILIPVGVIVLFLIIYPIVFLVYARTRGIVHGILGVLFYTIIIAVLMTTYIVLLGVSGQNYSVEMLYPYRFIIPVNFILLSLGVLDLPIVIVSFIYGIAGMLIIFYIPRRINIEKILLGRDKGILNLRLNRRKYIVIAFKDLLLSIRDYIRLRQFYGQAAAVLVPGLLGIIYGYSYILLFNDIIKLFIFLVYGFLGYVMASILVFILVFVEGEYSFVNYYLPLKQGDVVIGKTIASTLLVTPLFIIVAAVIAFLGSPIYALTTLLSMYGYWITASYINLSIVIEHLYNEVRAWTEFSISALRRLLINVVTLLPLAGLVVFILPLFLIDKLLATIAVAIAPIPITSYVLAKIFMGD